jgi:hypothetical protein
VRAWQLTAAAGSASAVTSLYLEYNQIREQGTGAIVRLLVRAARLAGGRGST